MVIFVDKMHLQAERDHHPKSSETYHRGGRWDTDKDGAKVNVASYRPSGKKRHHSKFISPGASCNKLQKLPRDIRYSSADTRWK